MPTSSGLKLQLVILTGTLLFSSASGAQTTSRLQSVEKLLQTSSAAQQIKNSNNQAARQKRDQAISIYQQAKEADSRGDETKAAELLQLATKTMFEATRMVNKDKTFQAKYLHDFGMVNKDKTFQAKYLHDFESRKASVEALCTAYENIAKEKGLVNSNNEQLHSDLHDFVQIRMDQAMQLKEQNRLQDGRKMLDEAYVASKVAIEQLRGGETLTHSLNFANSEEEYHYEVDRNDTHRMLVGILLKKKMNRNSTARAMVEKFLGKADTLRKQADSQASGGEYENAVTTLEQSTREIVRAIRSAGVYIPG